jgi:S1-C subfamily serine protease
MRAHLLVVSLAVGIVAAPEVGAAAERADSVVKVFASMRLPNPIRPWTKQDPIEINGSGVVIEGKKVLTNAHLVLYAGEVFVQARQGGDRVEAKVAAIGPGIDLAVLTLDDDSFFDNRPPMPRADTLPEPMANVVVYGFPVGGNGLSVTKGIVSRIEYGPYYYQAAGLRIQVDAAINAGNSGGPALVDNAMVGLIFSQLNQAENIGYIIPNEEIDTFLADVQDGRYDGKPRLTSHYQTLQNEALREKLGIDKKVKGLMIRAAGRRDSSSPLREYDVLTRIGDHPIDNEGMVPIRDNLRLPFTYLVPKLARDGTVPLGVLREHQPLTVAMPVGRSDDRLIREFDGGYPSYFVHGPLVFSPLMADAIGIYLQGNPFLMGQNSPRLSRRGDRVEFPGEELVVVTTPLLRHKIAKGYGDPFGQVLSEVNGIKIKSLRHLVEVLRDCPDPFLTFRFAEDLTEVLVFRRREMGEATEAVLTENGIAHRGSEDIMAVWSGKPTAAR